MVAHGEHVLGRVEEVSHRLGDLEIGIHLLAVNHLPELVVSPLVGEVHGQPSDHGTHETDGAGENWGHYGRVSHGRDLAIADGCRNYGLQSALLRGAEPEMTNVRCAGKKPTATRL